MIKSARTAGSTSAGNTGVSVRTSILNDALAGTLVQAATGSNIFRFT